MSEWTCEQVEPLLDLEAAGECDPAAHTAIQEHLERCPRCAAAWAEACRVRDLLDLHYQAPERLRRLQQRLRRESRPQPRARILSLTPRFGALAALLLVTLGLAALLGPIGLEPSPALELALVGPGPRAKPEQVRVASNDLPLGKRPHAAPVLEMTARLESAGGDRLQQLRALAAQGRFPPAPQLDLTLAVRNTQSQPITLFPGDSGTNLHLELTGPGVIGFPIAGTETHAFLRPERIMLQPGKEYTLSLQDLTDGSRGSLRRQYWTAPGEYRLWVRYLVGWSRGGDRPEGFLNLRTGPIRIRVQEH